MAILTFRIGDIKDRLEALIARFRQCEAEYYARLATSMVRSEIKVMGITVRKTKTLEQAVKELRNNWKTQYVEGRHWHRLACRLLSMPWNAEVQLSDVEACGLGLINDARRE